MSDKVFVRLLPANPRVGITVQGYTYRGYMFRGGERPTWYEVSQALADELSELRQVHSDPRSQPLFQICDESQKLATERGEQDKFLAAIGALTATISLPKGYEAPPTINLDAPSIAPPPITATDVMPSPLVDNSRAAAIPTGRAGGRRAIQAEKNFGAVTTADIPMPVTKPPGSNE